MNSAAKFRVLKAFIVGLGPFRSTGYRALISVLGRALGFLGGPEGSFMK